MIVKTQDNSMIVECIKLRANYDKGAIEAVTAYKEIVTVAYYDDPYKIDAYITKAASQFGAFSMPKDDLKHS